MCILSDQYADNSIFFCGSESGTDQEETGSSKKKKKHCTFLINPTSSILNAFFLYLFSLFAVVVVVVVVMVLTTFFFIKVVYKWQGRALVPSVIPAPLCDDIKRLRQKFCCWLNKEQERHCTALTYTVFARLDAALV